MISIYTYSDPVVYQIDHSQNSPGITGPVRWNGDRKVFEVNTGKDHWGDAHWKEIPNKVELRNSKEIDLVIEYVRTRMKEEEKLEKLAEKYPAVKNAKERLDLLVSLLDESNSN